MKRAQNGEFDHASESARRSAVADLVRSCSATAAAFAFQPFPIIDSAIITPIHQRMVQVVARIRGYRIDVRTVYDEILGPLRGEVVFHHVAMTAAKFVPFADILAVPVAYALTCALGDVSSEYYRRDRAMSKKEMKASFGAAYRSAHALAAKEKRNELRAMFRDPKTQQRIRELKNARRSGALAAEDVEKRIDDILNQPDHRR